MNAPSIGQPMQRKNNSLQNLHCTVQCKDLLRDLIQKAEKLDPLNTQIVS